MLRWLVLIPLAVFAGFVSMAAVGMWRGSDDLPSTLIGQTAPPITVQALPGYDALDPAALTSGEVTLVNFWASWCPPCRAEHPTLLKMQAQGLKIVGVNFKDQVTTAARYLGGAGSPFIAVPFDPQGRTAIDWGVTAPPETFILDGDGRVLFRFAGPLVGSDYEQRFLPALDAALRQQVRG